MLSVEAWTTIWYLHAQGRSIRAIALELGVARNTVRRALRDDERPRYQRPKRPNPKLAPFEAQIREWYVTHHFIGSRILRELRAVGYTGAGASSTPTCRRSRRQPSKEGDRALRDAARPQGQFDWSPYTVELGGARRRVVVYCLTLGYSRRKHCTASLDEC